MKVKIYGLPPNNNPNTKVWLYDDATYNTNGAVLLYEGVPNQDGDIEHILSKKYDAIRLVAIPDLFNEIGESLKASQLGVYHTVKLSLDMGLYSGSQSIPFNLSELHRLSQSRMRKDYRNARHRNWIIKGISAVATIGAAFFGWFIAGFWGLLGGCLLAILVVLLSSYASGHKKGI